MSIWLAKTPVTTNQVSLVSFGITLVSLALFLGGCNMWVGLAAQASSIVGGADGDRTRLKSMAPRSGDFFDAIQDRYVDVAVIGYLTYCSAIYKAKVSSGFVGLVALPALARALIISYTQARAETSMRLAFNGSILTLVLRDTQFLLVTVGAVPGQGLAILAVATNRVVIWHVGLARNNAVIHEE